MVGKIHNWVSGSTFTGRLFSYKPTTIRSTRFCVFLWESGPDVENVHELAFGISAYIIEPQPSAAQFIKGEQESKASQVAYQHTSEPTVAKGFTYKLKYS